MSSVQLTPQAAYVKPFQDQKDVKVLLDVLQKEANPVEFLKAIPEKKVVIVVPNEYSWPENLKPFKNPEHKHHYDTDLLAQDLESAGFTYLIRCLDYENWSFLICEAVKSEHG